MEDTIFSATEDNFNDMALEAFRFQAVHCPVYRSYIQHLHIKPESIEKVEDIPFLPLQLFKNQAVVTGKKPAALVFESSSTTGQIPSKHYIIDISVYERSILEGFNLFYGDPKQYTFLALLPHYLERGSSSLVYMVNCLMKQNPENPHGFFLHEH